MSNSFQNKKELRFVLTLGTGSFGASKGNQIILEGYRAVADIDKAGGMMMGTLRAQIFGVSQSDMNSCVTYPFQPSRLAGQAVLLNTIQVFAIDGNQETLVFTGNVVNAWGNYRAMPDVFLEIQAMSTAVGNLTPTAPVSYDGQIDVATAMKQIADKLGLTFENHGVISSLQNQYLPNSPLEQAQTIVQAAGVWMYIDNGVMSITPAGQPTSKIVPLISRATGMIGYPTFDSVGVNFQALFNPALSFGGLFEIQSDIPQANAILIATSISYKLESEKPSGAWFMSVRGTKSGLAISQ